MPSLLAQLSRHGWFEYYSAQLETTATQATSAVGVGTNKRSYTRAAALAKILANELEFGTDHRSLVVDLIPLLLPLYNHVKACSIGVAGTYDLVSEAAVMPDVNEEIDFIPDWTA